MHGQAFRLKNIYAEISALTKHLKELKQAFMKRSYQYQFPDKQFEETIHTRKKNHWSHLNLTMPAQIDFLLY